jgi:hypothetical protein
VKIPRIKLHENDTVHTVGRTERDTRLTFALWNPVANASKKQRSHLGWSALWQLTSNSVFLRFPVSLLKGCNLWHGPLSVDEDGKSLRNVEYKLAPSYSWDDISYNQDRLQLYPEIKYSEYHSTRTALEFKNSQFYNFRRPSQCC